MSLGIAFTSRVKGLATYFLLNALFIYLNCNKFELWASGLRIKIAHSVGGMKAKRIAKKPFSRYWEISTGYKASITTKKALFYTTCYRFGFYY